jgi:hypothetical protein
MPHAQTTTKTMAYRFDRFERSSRTGIAGLLGLLLLHGCGHDSSPRPDGSAPDTPLGIEVAKADVGGVDGPACPASCDDLNPCTNDGCDLTTYACAHTPVPDGTRCLGKPCTTNSVCMQGLCLDGPIKTCAASDSCHLAGVCSPATGECTNPIAPSTTLCDDGDGCTFSDRCVDGRCSGTRLICRSPNLSCDPATRSCPGEFPTPLGAWVFANLRAPENSNALARDPAGNIYLGGTFYDILDLGASPLATASLAAGRTPTSSWPRWMQPPAKPSGRGRSVRQGYSKWPASRSAAPVKSVWWGR